MLVEQVQPYILHSKNIWIKWLGNAAELSASLIVISRIHAAEEQKTRNNERTDLIKMVPATISKLNNKGQEVTKMSEQEISALLLSHYCIDTVASLKKKKKPFFVAKL